MSAEDRLLWHRFAADVRPIKGRRALPMPVDAGLPQPAPASKPASRPLAAPPRPAPVAPKVHANTLDAGWDKRLAKGSVAPDRTIDLHGHNLHGAHALLDHALGDAIRQGARLVLLITGRPARDNPRLPPTSRGVIRASVMDWIAAGPWSAHIAAVRNAHPRHGGHGALYLVIRRAR